MQQEEKNDFIYTFLSFYVLQRIFVSFFIYLIRQKSSEIFLIITLSLLQLEEFYVLSYPSYFLVQPFYRFLFSIIFLSSPLGIITLIWTLNHLSYQTIIFQTIHWIGFFLAMISFMLLVFFGFKITLQKIDLIQYLKIQILAIIHFASHICLICINCSFNLNGLYFILVYTLLSIVLVISLRRTKEERIHEIPFVFWFIIHIVIDPQDLIQFGNQNVNFKYLLFDIQNIFSFAMKLYLLLVFVIQYHDNINNNNNEMYIFRVLLLIVTIISLSLIGYKILKNTLCIRYIKPTYIQFSNISEFIKEADNQSNFFQKNRNDINKQLKMIFILSKESHEFFTSDKLNYTKHLLFTYNKCQIIYSNGYRQNIDGDRQWQYISLSPLISMKELLTIVEEKKILPMIQYVDLQFKDDNYNIIRFYQKLIENNIGVLFTTKQDKEEISIINKNIFYIVKQICAQYKAYQKYLFKYQLINSNILFYDLFDDLIT